jgi:uncharacterized membrane protein YhaH (DUF805 family)
MEKIKKYFEFSGTINGTTYFLRNLLSVFGSFLGGFIIGLGIADGSVGLISLGLIIVTPFLWFNVATIYKRILALAPKDATGFTIGLILIQLIGSFIVDETFGSLVKLVSLVIGLILIFKNSNIENHEG